MKMFFYIGLFGIALFEILNVYFIMPMPGSQRMDSLDLAYLLHQYRWFFRIGFGLLLLWGIRSAFDIRHKWIPALLLLLVGFVIYQFNFEMSADQMFQQPQVLSMLPVSESKVSKDRIILGVEQNGAAKAYPIQFLSYHHQVRDAVGGKPIMVTYCNVCRSGRVFEPLVNGKMEEFRLVGMDHFNAMFEDKTTKSWWRQENGEAVTGRLKGTFLPEFPSTQTTLEKWLILHPHSLIMQSDDASIMEYDSLARFEQGKSKGDLTRTDSLSWQDKSWVVGIQIGEQSKAYDWNRLKKERIIQDQIDNQPIAIVLASDNKSFMAFEKPTAESNFTIQNDTIFVDNQRYDLSGRSIEKPVSPLKKVNVYQEFWHSWRTFHPKTERY
jgi:hypothetical protein